MRKDDQSMLDELLDYGGGRLSSWDIEFIESLNQQRDRDLSFKQQKALERMWRKVFDYDPSCDPR